MAGTEESAEAVIQKCPVNKVFGKKCVKNESLFNQFHALRPATLTICFYFS